MGIFQCKSQQLLFGKHILICLDEKEILSSAKKKKNNIYIASNLAALTHTQALLTFCDSHGTSGTFSVD